jgi:hypothetical protein
MKINHIQESLPKDSMTQPIGLEVDHMLQHLPVFPDQVILYQTDVATFVVFQFRWLMIIRATIKQCGVLFSFVTNDLFEIQHPKPLRRLNCVGQSQQLKKFMDLVDRVTCIVKV